MRQEFRRDIQSLRGLAVLSVVIFHNQEWLLPLGYLGVDVFFVISGFVVTPLVLRIYTTKSRADKILELRKFFSRRFFRLAPALSVMFLFSSLFIFFLGNPEDHRRFATQGIASLFLVGNLGAYKYSGNYFEPNPNPLVHTWSLSVEEQIYILLPLLMLVVIRNSHAVYKKSIVLFGSITIFSLAIFSFPATIGLFLNKESGLDVELIAFYSSFTRVWQFTLGGIAYMLIAKHPSLFRFQNRISVVLVVVFAAFLLFPKFTIEPFVASIVVSMLTILLISQRSLDLLPEALQRFLEWFGNRSYSIYLLHMPIAYLAHYYSKLQILDLSPHILEVLSMVGAVLFGSVVYSLVEIRFKIDSRKEPLKEHRNLLSSLFLTTILPLITFSLILITVANSYWGANQNIARPKAAWETLVDCKILGVMERPCIYSVPNALGTILLIGDSHAAHIAQAVITAANEKQWSAAIWSQEGCNIRFRTSSKSQTSSQCFEQNERVLTWAKSNNPELILLSQYVYIDTPQSELREGLTRFHSLGSKVVLVENNPIFPDRFEYMVQRPLILPPYSAPKSFPIHSMNTRDLKASNKLASWARKHDITTLNFSPLFCSPIKCTRYSNSKWLYYDDDHFSVDGAKRTIPTLKELMRKIYQ